MDAVRYSTVEAEPILMRAGSIARCRRLTAPYRPARSSMGFSTSVGRTVGANHGGVSEPREDGLGLRISPRP